MNYDFRKHCRRFFAEESIDSEEFNNRVVDMITRYRKQTVYSQLNVLDTHDVSRYERKVLYLLLVNMAE